MQFPDPYPICLHPYSYG